MGSGYAVPRPSAGRFRRRAVPRRVGVPRGLGVARRVAVTRVRGVLDLDAPGPTINRHVYGHFAEHLGRCIYGGFFVGEDSHLPNEGGIRLDVVEALKALDIPNLRWPGGCFADEYHWLKGVGEQRQPMVNTHWGGVIETNAFGTHEYFDLLNQLDAEAYVATIS